MITSMTRATWRAFSVMIAPVDVSPAPEDAGPMLRALKFALLALIAVIVAAFAIGNRTGVVLSLWPFGLELALPLFLALEATLLLGLLLGGLIAWLRAGRHRARARRLARRVEELEGELHRLRAATASPPSGPAAPAGPALPGTAGSDLRLPGRSAA